MFNLAVMSALKSLGFSLLFGGLPEVFDLEDFSDTAGESSIFFAFY